MPNLYLIPTTLANPVTSHALLAHQLQLVSHLQHFIVETAKTGRQHLKQLSLATPLQELTLQELNKHQTDLPSLIKPLLEGNDMGLLSDCGLPAIADPGSKVVHLAHSHGIKVVPLVGPSSLLLALMSSGVNGQSFAFTGYLPIDKEERIQSISRLQYLVEQNKQSQIIIEAPFRNQQLLELLIAKLPANFILSLAINLMNEDERIINHTINEWKKQETLPTIHKEEVVFVIGL